MHASDNDQSEAPHEYVQHQCSTNAEWCISLTPLQALGKASELSAKKPEII